MIEVRYPTEELVRLSQRDPQEVGPALVALAKEVLEHRANATVTATQIAGYTAQSDAKVALVNEFKADEERLLRKLDALSARNEHERRRKNLDAIYTDTLEADEALPLSDPRWLAIARTHFHEGFMALNRAVFQPQRIRLPEDEIEAAAARMDLP